jgi:hypothetical protein
MLDEIVNFKPSGFQRRQFNRIDPRTRQKGNLRKPRTDREKEREAFAIANLERGHKKLQQRLKSFKEWCS